jgi:hypothetical protein
MGPEVFSACRLFFGKEKRRENLPAFVCSIACRKRLRAGLAPAEGRTVRKPSGCRAEARYFRYLPRTRVWGVSISLLVMLRFLTTFSTSPMPAMFVTRLLPP